MKKVACSVFAALTVSAVAIPSFASPCGSALNVAEAIWKKVGGTVTQKGCKGVEDCMKQKDKWEETVRDAVAFWNEQSAGGWATIGPRPLLVDGSWNDGKVVLGGQRLFITRVPMEEDEFSINVIKEGGGGADVTISTFDGKVCAPGQKASFEKKDKNGTKKQLKVKGAKGKLVMVKVNADKLQAFDYKFRAALHD